MPRVCRRCRGATSPGCRIIRCSRNEQPGPERLRFMGRRRPGRFVARYGTLTIDEPRTHKVTGRLIALRTYSSEMGRMNLPLKWHGGKYYLASRIVDLMPPHIHYVEPFFGGGAVLLSRDPNDESLWLKPHKGVSEVANDINGRLVNFSPVLQDPAQLEDFHV